MPLAATVAALLLLGVGGWVALRPRHAVTTVSANGGLSTVHRDGAPAAAAPTTSDAPAPGVVVTPAVAKDVLASYWPSHERALADGDLTTLGALSGGAAREWEQPTVACGCLDVGAGRPLLAASYLVPRQTHYPATFVAAAQTQYAGVDWIELLVFTKQRAGAPWLVTEDSGYGPQPGAAPQLISAGTGPDGYDAAVTPAQHRRALTVAADLAAVWQQAKETGSVPTGTGFDFSGQSLERVSDLTSGVQDGVQVNGLLGHYQFYISSADPLVEVADAAGYDLACQVLRESVVYRPTPGRRIRQGNNRQGWGPELEPGYYRKVTSRDVWQTCFLIAPDASAPVIVLNQDVGGAFATGVR